MSINPSFLPEPHVESGLAATRVWTLGSGSRGNAALVEHGDARILLDAGFELPELVARLRMVGVAPATIDDVVISHGHRDHVLGAASGARIYGWRVWATLGTVWQWRALRHVDVRPFEADGSFDAPPFRVHAAATPHDVADSSAIVVEVPATGARVGYCTDLGHAPPAVRDLLRDLDVLILEANYDAGMLAAGPYPPDLQARVSGDHGHLGNEQAAALLRDVAGPRLRHVVLAHISRHNNTPERALQAAHEALAGTGYRGDVAVAPQDAVLGPMVVPAAAAASFSAVERGATFPP